MIVEGAHYDPIWGVGLAWDDPLIEDPANWKGKNQLGDVITSVMCHNESFQSMCHMSPYSQFDEWTRRIVDRVL